MCIKTPIAPQKRILLSDIYAEHFEAYLRSAKRKLCLKDKHFEAVNKAKVCRTDQLGIGVFACEGCGVTKYIYRSCKHRFCGQCGTADTMRWAERVLGSLLDMKHHHIVWTLPKPFRFLAKRNGTLQYDLLFRTSAEVIKSWFNARHNLRPGIINVLHTAGSDLKYHPHVHMIVTRGGRDVDNEEEYREVKGNYLCPQKYLGAQLRIKFQQALIKYYDKKLLKVPKSLKSHSQFVSWLYKVKQKHWVVSIQDALADPSHIVSYVGRYTKRSCLSEYKILEAGKTIKFQYNDYENTPRGEKTRISIREMSPFSFLDELLQHVPKKRYQMVRYYGIYCSLYLNEIPSELRAEVKRVEVEFDEDYDWGEFGLFRKVVILSGKPDPLLCTDCNKSMVFVGVLIKGKLIEGYDSS